MTKIVKILTQKEPFIKKFFKLRKKGSLQKTAYMFFIMTLVCIDINTETWEKPIMTELAYAAEAREVILYPSEKLSMIVLSEGTAPELANISEQNGETVITYFSEEPPTLLTEVMGISRTSESEVLSSQEYITDKVIEDGELLAKETRESEKKHDASNKEEAKEKNETIENKAEEALVRKEEEQKSLEPVYINNPDMVISITESELDLLERLVQCEAGGEDMTGKILVANVVINRVNSSEFPNTVKGVINAKNQFSPVSSGIIDSAVADSSTKEAVMRALSGEDYSKNSLYFISRRYASSSAAAWFDNNLEKTVEHGTHEFFK